ncbi:hypothetical protein [Flavobacterium oreochromis]|uniref:Lipoprotein n=1 Tax=Flavobacterium oreochromis TaxID=2906078 RepID=A0ABW8PC01_9FLAO
MKKIATSFLLLLALNCKSQIKKQDISNIKKDTMEIFNIEKYKNLKKDMNVSGYGNYILENGDKIRVESGKDYYSERITKNNTNLSTYKEFFASNKSIKKTVNFLHNIHFGIAKEYDEQGKLIRETNYNLPYKYTIEDLATKMNNQYQIDIYNIKQIHSINRYEEKKHLKIPLYEVWSYHKTNPLKLTCYIINGTTGETIYECERFIEGKQGSLLDQYLKTKNK